MEAQPEDLIEGYPTHILRGGVGPKCHLQHPRPIVRGIGI